MIIILAGLAGLIVGHFIPILIVRRREDQETRKGIMATKIADAGWDDGSGMPIIQYLMKNGCAIETDNYGQIVVYTGLYENSKGELVEPEESEIDDDGQYVEDAGEEDSETDNDEDVVVYLPPDWPSA